MPIPAPPFTTPILARIIRRARLSLDAVALTDPTHTGFVLTLQLSLTHAGPFPAQVTFPHGIEIWSVPQDDDGEDDGLEVVEGPGTTPPSPGPGSPRPSFGGPRENGGPKIPFARTKKLKGEHKVGWSDPSVALETGHPAFSSSSRPSSPSKAKLKRTDSTAKGVSGSVRIIGGRGTATLTVAVHLDPKLGPSWLEHILLHPRSPSSKSPNVKVKVKATVRVTALFLRWQKVGFVKDVNVAGMAGLEGAIVPAREVFAGAFALRSSRPASPTHQRTTSSHSPIHPPSRPASEKSHSKHAKKASKCASPPGSRRNPIPVRNFDILPSSSSTSGILCSASLVLSNPSPQLSAQLGHVHFDLFSAADLGVVLGSVEIPKLEVARRTGKEGEDGEKEVRVEISLDPVGAGPTGRQFIADFLSPLPPSASDSGLELLVRGKSDRKGWIPSLLNRISLSTSVARMDDLLLADVQITFPEHDGPDQLSTVVVRLKNPFSAPIRVMKLLADFWLTDPAGGDPKQRDDEPLGTIKGAQGGNLDILVGPHETVATRPEDTTVTLDLTPAFLVKVLRSAAATSKVDVSGIEGVLRLAEGRADGVDPDETVPVALGRRTSVGQSGRDEPLVLVEVVRHALAGLKVDVRATAKVGVGEAKGRGYAPPYEVEATISQRAVPTKISDSEVHRVVEKVATPVAGQLLESASIVIRRLQLLFFDSEDRSVSKVKEGGNEVPVKLGLVVGGLAALGELQAIVGFEGGMEVEWGGQVAARLRFDEHLTVDGSKDHVAELRGMLHVEDPARFTRLVKSLATTPSLDLQTACANLSLTVAGVAIAPRVFAKKVRIAGLDSLSNLELESFDLPSQCDPAKGEGEGIVLRAVGEVASDSALEVDIEEIDVDLFYLDGDIGSATIKDVSLRQGQTAKLEVNGRLWAKSSARALRGLASLISEAMAGQTVKAVARIRAVRLAHGLEIPWLVNALDKLEIPIPIKLKDSAAKEVLQEIKLNTIGLTFRDDDHLPTLTCPQIQITIKNPFGFPLSIRRIGGAIGIGYKGQHAGLIEIADFDIVDPKPTDKDGLTTFSLAFNESKIHQADMLVLSAFAATAVDSHQESILIDGKYLQILIDTPAGEMSITNLNIGTEAEIAGLKGIRHMPAQLTDVRVAKGEKDNLKVTMKAWFNSHGQISVKAEKVTERVSLPVYYGDDRVMIGRAVFASSFFIEPGPTHIPISFQYSPRPEESRQAAILLTDFLSGRTSTLHIRGDDQSAASRVLCEALKKVELDASLKPMADKTLIQGISISLGLNVAVKNCDCTFSIANPFELPLQLLKVVATANYRGQPFGTLAPVFKDFVVPPASSASIPSLATSPSFVVRLRQPLDKLVGSWGAARGNLVLDLDLEAEVLLGQYPITGFKYKQGGLPLRIHGLEGVSKFLSYFPL